jgi:mono/diheme cytochrome c family protein
LVVLVLALPFLDRSIERRPWKRPIAMGAYVFVLVGLVGLALRSQYLDSHDPGIAQQLAKQKSEEADYMRKPFEPELSSGSLAAANTALADPLAAKGKTIFEAQSCNACHGDNGIGSAAGPKLVGVGNKFDSQKLEALLKRPSTAMSQGGMTPTELNGEELKALIAYVASLK